METNEKGGQPAEGHGQDKEVTFTVNGKNVTMPKGDATGLQIKQAAINQGVAIELNFILELEGAHGKGEVIADGAEVKLKNGLVFTAIRNDDNS